MVSFPLAVWAASCSVEARDFAVAGDTRSLKYTTGRALLAFVRGRPSTSLCWVLSVMSQIRVITRLHFVAESLSERVEPAPARLGYGAFC